MHFGVVGAGVVGLTTALELQKQFPTARVSILADKFDVETTSDVAGGIFRPSPSFMGPSEAITTKWINDSYEYWDALSQSEDAPLAGITELSAYIFSSVSENIVRNHYLEKLLPCYRICTEDELKICPGNWKYGSFFTTIMTECRIWQPWAMQKFEGCGGKIQRKHIANLTELASMYDVVMNCTGLGAQQLCGDRKMVPIRGQVIKVRAPWIKTAFYADYDTYIFPGFNGVVTLGGVRQYESYNLNVSKYDSLDIRERCESLVPSLRDAVYMREAVGLRPHRSTVRVEKEILTSAHNGQVVKCIHNYGHGGYGVTSSPGTAIYAVKLVKELLGRSGSKL